VSYNASAVKIYYAMGSLVHFKKQKYFLPLWKKRSIESGGEEI
jgi:hypothetical protein